MVKGKVMAKQLDIYTTRKSLDEICTVPEKIISVYSLEKHVWTNSNSEAARSGRKPELKTIEEFQIDPVRPFMNDILRNMAAPYNPEKKDHPIGQGYWIQAEFGSGKSHLLAFLSALALGHKGAWEIIREKEQKAGRGKRESLYRFWEEGLAAKSGNGAKGIFVIVKTLVGAGGGTIGLSDKGLRLSEYILDAAKEQLQVELGKNISLYPAELLADRFITKDLDLYRSKLAKYLKDPKYFDEDEFENVDDFIRDIQQNKSPEYKRSCGNKLWDFYTRYLEVTPQVAAETEDVLKYLVETILAEGYSGVLLVLDEVSLFMKNRDDDQRADDEKTLVVLSNRLAKIHNLPIWTVCAAQQAIESKMGVKNIIADDRLKLVKLLEEDKGYYDIVLARVREVKEPKAVGSYYLHYKRGFSWPNSIGEEEFRHFFPFHKPALEVLRAITYELTTTRSAIHFMHQTLKYQIKHKGCELIRLWELFDEAVRYEEDPSGVHAGLVAIKTRRETDYRAYEACKRQIDGLTKGYLKVYRDRAVKTVQTLFLLHIARTRQQGVSPEEIANSVLIEREPDANVDENIQHYETLAENLKKELRQIVQSYDEDSRPRYRFDPIFTGVDPRDEFRKARDEAEAHEVMLREAWEHLLALDEWPVRTRQMTIDLSSGVKSIFRDIAPFVAPWEERSSSRHGDQELEINWNGRQISGQVGMRDFARLAHDNLPLPPIESDQTDLDFGVFIATRPATHEVISKILLQRKDPRLLLWTPGELTHEERERLLDFAAYRKLISDWQGKDTEDAIAVINWVANALQTELGKILKIVNNSYARGRIDAHKNSKLEFHVAGELTSILTPLVDKVLSSSYESKDIKFDPPFLFRREEGVKVINGIVRTGSIPKGAKPNQNISAAQNFGFALKIMKKSAEKDLDTSENAYVQDMWHFVDDKLTDDGQAMKMETLYKNFMGIGGPKDYGLTRRMVQIFLLCLLREGKVRITVGPKAGIPYALIDYSNVGSIEFSAKILDSLMEVQKVARPENWEVLRPYAEKLLSEEIPVTHDDAIISAYRTRLRQLFAKERDESVRTASKAKSLFEALKAANPYATILDQVVTFFSSDIEGGDDISLVLFAMKGAFGYEAFDSNAAAPAEVDDLANRLRNYHDMKQFLSYQTELLTACSYCSHTVPEKKQFDDIRAAQHTVCHKLNDLQSYIDSEVKLKMELIGKIPAHTGESGTLGALIRDYTTAYAILHDTVIDRTEHCRRDMQNLMEGDDLRTLKTLENITALQPPISDQIEQELAGLMGSIFLCSTPSRSSIEEQLKRGPVHECGLSLRDIDTHLQEAEAAVMEGTDVVESGLNSKIEIFLTPAVRERLSQGREEPVIADILNCKDVSELRSTLIRWCNDDPSIVSVINRYLMRIIVKRVEFDDFEPSLRTFEQSEIATITKEFEKFLEKQLSSIEADDDVLPMLQLK